MDQEEPAREKFGYQQAESKIIEQKTGLRGRDTDFAENQRNRQVINDRRFCWKRQQITPSR
jgi:hypothetical protein